MIYFITDGEAVKIGFSAADPVRRLSDLQVANPRELRLVHVMLGDEFTEAALHIHYRDLHLRGEWFKAEGPLAWVVDSAASRPDYLGSTEATRRFVQKAQRRALMRGWSAEVVTLEDCRAAACRVAALVDEAGEA